MTRADIAANIAVETGLSREDSMKAVEAFMQTVNYSLMNEESVYLRGFGTFSLLLKKEKMGRNILANTPMVIPAHYTVRFVPSLEMKKLIKEIKVKL